jgi:hypothetical protein
MPRRIEPGQLGDSATECKCSGGRSERPLLRLLREYERIPLLMKWKLWTTGVARAWTPGASRSFVEVDVKDMELEVCLWLCQGYRYIRN